MVRTLLWLCLLIQLSCNGEKHNTLVKINREYTIIYMNGYYSRLTVYDNNDTIYLTNSQVKGSAPFIKVKSHHENIERIKDVIKNHINYDCITVNHESYLDRGYLQVDIIEKDKKISCQQPRIGKDLAASKKFSHLFNFLGDEYEEVQKVFKLDKHHSD